MKRYAIVEVSAQFDDDEIEYLTGIEFTVWIKKSDLLTGPVELMQAACTEAGVKLRMPKVGDWVMSGSGVWYKIGVETDLLYVRPVIPAPEPEPEKSCPNCQGINRGEHIDCHRLSSRDPFMCSRCGKYESEWTYATDLGGIGGGGTGGPL